MAYTEDVNHTKTSNFCPYQLIDYNFVLTPKKGQNEQVSAAADRPRDEVPHAHRAVHRRRRSVW